MASTAGGVGWSQSAKLVWFFRQVIAPSMDYESELFAGVTFSSPRGTAS